MANENMGFSTDDAIRTLQEAGTTTYIPLWSGRVGSSKYLKGELVCDKKRDRFRCLRGKYVMPNPATYGNCK